MSAIEKSATYKQLSIHPITPNIGAEIQDIDLSTLDSPGLKDELRRALFDFQVLFFRDQHISPEQQVTIARVFGDPDKVKSLFPRHESQKSIEKVESSPQGYRYGNDQWHADVTFSSNPPTGTVLYAHVIPPIGGDTLWASATAVYKALPVKLREYLADLEAIHSIENSGWAGYFDQLADGQAQFNKTRVDHPPVVHPVIQTHPVTGEKILYVNPEFTTRIKGLPRQQSDALLNFLFHYFLQPEYQVRLRWDNNTVAIWDNRATLHYAVADYNWQERKLSRITFGEDTPF
jgi:taurine dioxygenase